MGEVRDRGAHSCLRTSAALGIPPAAVVHYQREAQASGSWPRDSSLSGAATTCLRRVFVCTRHEGTNEKTIRSTLSEARARTRSNSGTFMRHTSAYYRQTCVKCAAFRIAVHLAVLGKLFGLQDPQHRAGPCETGCMPIPSHCWFFLGVFCVLVMDFFAKEFTTRARRHKRLTIDSLDT